MNYLWAGMILIGIIFGAFNGGWKLLQMLRLTLQKKR